MLSSLMLKIKYEFLIDRVEKIFLGLDSKKLGLQFFEDGLRHFQAYEFKQAKRKFEAAAQLLPNQLGILNNLGITLQ